jgi:hypothetical protein
MKITTLFFPRFFFHTSPASPSNQTLFFVWVLSADPLILMKLLKVSNAVTPAKAGVSRLGGIEFPGFPLSRE